MPVLSFQLESARSAGASQLLDKLLGSIESPLNLPEVFLRSSAYAQGTLPGASLHLLDNSEKVEIEAQKRALCKPHETEIVMVIVVIPFLPEMGIVVTGSHCRKYSSNRLIGPKSKGDL
jgi:hypothetical protein